MALIGRYRVEKLLGRGGAGEVYLAQDLARGGRTVALKRIRARVDQRLREAFEREFAIMASLSVFGIAEVFDFGVAEADEGFAGGAFFTRSYVEGQPMDLASAQLDLTTRLSLFARLCAVISPLHRIGVVHGDLKPGNVVVTDQGQVSVIDFGLSRVLGSAREAGVAGGTPPFMAPENLQGEAISTTSDVYALGTMLWQLITDALPFAELGVRASGAKLRGEAPKRPPLLDQVAASAVSVAERALCHDPLDRFPSVAEMLEALLPLLPPDRRPGPAPLVSPRPRGRADLLAELEARLVAARSTVTAVPNPGGRSRMFGIIGEQGSGKSLVMRELKWRLQLNGVQVIELFVAEAAGRPPSDWLLGELRALAGHAIVESSSAPEGGIEAILKQLFELSAGRQTVLLVDDLDAAEPGLGELLRTALHEERGEGVALVFAAQDDRARALAALGPVSILPLAPLSPSVVSALCTDVLGPVDATVLEALTELSRGVPAILMEALVALSDLSAPTVADVRALAPGQAGAAFARARLQRADPETRPLLVLLAVAESVSLAAAHCVLADATQGALDRLLREGLLSTFGDELRFSDASLGKTLKVDASADGLQKEASALIGTLAHVDVSAVTRARLAVAAGDVESMRATIPEATRMLRDAGALLAALPLSEALLPHVSGAEWVQEQLHLAQGRQSLGQYELSVKHARAVIGASPAAQADRVQARLIAARGLTALAEFDAAVDILSGTSQDGAAPQSPRLFQELARIHVRRGDYDAAELAADDGLAIAPQGAVERIELLCSKGLVASYRDRGKEARASYEDALALARRVGAPADEAKVLSYLAIGSHRGGEPERARDLFAQALDIAREVLDFGFMANASLNLGAILFYLGDAGASERHYASASRLAKRAGSVATDLQARNNLAHVHVYLGLYEQARGELTELSEDAERAGHRYVMAQLKAVTGDLYARTGDLDRALIAYDDAIARYTELGQMREAAEHHQDAAEALLDRDGPADLSAAVARLSYARGLVKSHALDDLQLRQDLLTARARLASGDVEQVVPDFESLLSRAEGQRSREVLWMTLAATAKAHALLGAEVAGGGYLRRAVEVLEEQALRLPREYREAYWHDPRRRRVRGQMGAHAESTHIVAVGQQPLASALADPRMVRLLEIIKRLAAEHELDRLLERIVDSAVELSAAERGYVLLVDEDGQLEPHVARGRSGAMEEAAIAFSRSIAEAVLIDGDSIVTTDATDDGRLQGYASVHQLTLRSVACLPIRSSEGTVGVLYLEHRRSKGRFNEASVELLHAFADQAAIALQNARLLEENSKRQAELLTANRALAVAKQQLEEALSARLEQLHEVQGELARVIPSRRGQARHGLIGSSKAMQRVWTMVERLKDASVPVVVRGESGTGKELLARAIHYAGVRQKEPFVAINCGALPESLLESELFGHVRGAFSGAERDKTGLIARAHGGTLFLDEVSDMPPQMQLDLLRVLQEGTVCRLGSELEERVSVRFVAASQRDLQELVAEGRFREDLYYRLNVVELPVPPLRERREDIPELCRYFLAKFKEEQGLPEKVVSPDGLRALMGSELRGNVRELEHCLLHGVLMSSERSLSAVDLGLHASPEGEPRPVAAAPEQDAPDEVPTTVAEHRDHEKQRILSALEQHSWNRAKTAKALGMARRTFYRRLQDYEILQ